MIRPARAASLFVVIGGIAILSGTADLAGQQRLGGPGQGQAVGQERQGARQGGATGQGQDDRRETMARVQAEHERRMVEELGITRAQGTLLRALLHRYRETRMQIMAERAQIREDLVRHSEVGGSEGDAQRILDRMRALRARELEMQRAEEEALLDILTPSQILQMQVLRDRFSEQIRQLERSRAGGRPREHREEPSEGVLSR
jgi:hypothetical protein